MNEWQNMNKSEKRVLVGMSGGIDSTATCLMLREQGYEIVGLTMWVWGDEPVEARNLADSMGIEHHVADEREAFRQIIVQNFIDEYRRGRTPNPCVMCNPLFKFRILTEWADRLGCAFIATGHYTRLEERNGKVYIVAGDDDKKDQSYFLWRLGQEVLKRCIFPLGAFTKMQVREYLRDKGYTLKAEEGGKHGSLLHQGRLPRLLARALPGDRQRGGAGMVCQFGRRQAGRAQRIPLLHHRAEEGAGDCFGQTRLRAENQSAEEHRDAGRCGAVESRIHACRRGKTD